MRSGVPISFGVLGFASKQTMQCSKNGKRQDIEQELHVHLQTARELSRAREEKQRAASRALWEKAGGDCAVCHGGGDVLRWCNPRQTARQYFPSRCFLSFMFPQRLSSALKSNKARLDLNGSRGPARH